MNAVLFDMDGLMFDTERLNISAWDYAGEKLGLGKVGEYVTMKTLGTNNALTEEIWRREYGTDFDFKALRAYTKEFLNDFYSHNRVPVRKGLYSLLEYLRERGCKTAVVSSSNVKVVEHHLKSAEVSDYFSAVIGGDMVEKSKPEPDIYLRGCEELGEAPEDCLALEDSRNGLIAAHRAGCAPIMVPDLWQPDEEIKNITLNICADLDEVKDFLKKSETV